jgi:hypothetical protein
MSLARIATIAKEEKGEQGRIVNFRIQNFPIPNLPLFPLTVLAILARDISGSGAVGRAV